MSNFYTGRIYCAKCKKEIDWFCAGKSTKWGEENPPAGSIQMTHSYDYFNKKEMFDGYCHCGARIRLSDDIVNTIPMEYYVDLP